MSWKGRAEDITRSEDLVPANLAPGDGDGGGVPPLPAALQRQVTAEHDAVVERAKVMLAADAYLRRLRMRSASDAYLRSMGSSLSEWERERGLGEGLL